MIKKRFFPLIALLVLSLICACIPAQAQEWLPPETPAQTVSEMYSSTETVMERKVVPKGETGADCRIYTVMQASKACFCKTACSGIVISTLRNKNKTQDRAFDTLIVV